MRVARCLSSLGALSLVLVLVGCAQQQTQTAPAPPPDTRPADEATIRNASIEWNKVTQARDLDKFVAYYADNAARMKNNSPTINGKDAIRADWKMLFDNPNAALTFKTTSVDVAKSGDLAVEYGIYDLVTTDKKKKMNDEKGKYIVVWGKQPDGMWKAIADIENYGH